MAQRLRFQKGTVTTWAAKKKILYSDETGFWRDAMHLWFRF